jgi:hypothetical protein
MGNLSSERQWEESFFKSFGLSRCTRCRDFKPLEEFSPNPLKKDGHQSHCRSCCRAAHSLWYERAKKDVKKLSAIREQEARNRKSRNALRKDHLPHAA